MTLPGLVITVNKAGELYATSGALYASLNLNIMSRSRLDENGVNITIETECAIQQAAEMARDFPASSKGRAVSYFRPSFPQVRDILLMTASRK